MFAQHLIWGSTLFAQALWLNIVSFRNNIDNIRKFEEFKVNGNTPKKEHSKLEVSDSLQQKRICFSGYMNPF